MYVTGLFAAGLLTWWEVLGREAARDLIKRVVALAEADHKAQHGEDVEYEFVGTRRTDDGGDLPVVRPVPERERIRKWARSTSEVTVTLDTLPLLLLTIHGIRSPLVQKFGWGKKKDLETLKGNPGETTHQDFKKLFGKRQGVKIAATKHCGQLGLRCCSKKGARKKKWLIVGGKNFHHCNPKGSKTDHRGGKLKYAFSLLRGRRALKLVVTQRPLSDFDDAKAEAYEDQNEDFEIEDVWDCKCEAADE